MLVKDALKRDNNNLDLIRIFCAISVIFAHSYYLANSDGARSRFSLFSHLHILVPLL